MSRGAREWRGRSRGAQRTMYNACANLTDACTFSSPEFQESIQVDPGVTHAPPFAPKTTQRPAGAQPWYHVKMPLHLVVGPLGVM